MSLKAYEYLKPAYLGRLWGDPLAYCGLYFEWPIGESRACIPPPDTETVFVLRLEGWTVVWEWFNDGCVSLSVHMTSIFVLALIHVIHNKDNLTEVISNYELSLITENHGSICLAYSKD